MSLTDVLLRASADGNLTKVKEIVLSDPSLANRPGPHPYWGGTPQPLQVASEWGRKEVVEFLLDSGADPECAESSYGGWKPLHCAIHRGHEVIVGLLLERGAVVDAWAAASMGDVERLALLLSTQGDLATSAAGPNNATPLHFAATGPAARLLLAHGASPDALDSYVRTPLENIACYGSRRLKAAQEILSLRPCADLALLCALGDLDGVRRLKELSAVPNARGVYPLHAAAEHGRVEIARLLIISGADINQAAAEGITALHQAAGNGQLEMVQLLVSLGADPRIEDTRHNSTAHGWAKFQGHQSVADYLAALR